jgi:hypothetical protein
MNSLSASGHTESSSLTEGHRVAFRHRRWGHGGISILPALSRLPVVAAARAVAEAAIVRRRLRAAETRLPRGRVLQENNGSALHPAVAGRRYIEIKVLAAAHQDAPKGRVPAGAVLRTVAESVNISGSVDRQQKMAVYEINAPVAQLDRASDF